VILFVVASDRPLFKASSTSKAKQAVGAMAFSHELFISKENQGCSQGGTLARLVAEKKVKRNRGR